MKGIIIAAGYGTRFLPCTKTIPKEMFPLIDTPAIELIVNEFLKSGIKDILIVTSRRKKSLEDYFDREIELESYFKNKNDTEKLESIKPKEANLFFLRQKEMLGTGHAILICRNFIKDDSFVVAYPDDIIFSDVPLTKQLIDIHNETGGNVLAAEILKGDVSRYGVIDFQENNGLLKVKRVIEKPKPGKEPTKLISVGRYLFTSDILELLKKEFNEHKGGEFYQINSINKLADENKVFACMYKGERIDIGDKIGYLEGIIKYSLTRDDLKESARKILKKYL